MKMTRRNFLSASALTLLSCQLAPAARADCLLSGLFHGADTALPPKPLTAKVVDANPFMGRSESNIHHDCYNTDSTDAVLPVGICPEVNVAMEKTNPNASPAIFFDNFDNPVSPFLGGLAIRDLDAEEVRTIGFFSPAKHDGGGYLIQSSYSFVDGRNLIVCPFSIPFRREEYPESYRDPAIRKDECYRGRTGAYAGRYLQRHRGIEESDHLCGDSKPEVLIYATLIFDSA